MLDLKGVHHIAIICSDYKKSKTFYTEILGFEVIQEIYREQRDSYKLDLALHGNYIIELFSFPNPAERPSYPEASGLRHLAFQVVDIEKQVKILTDFGIKTEPIRVDETSNKRFTFFTDPDGLPLELYEI
ncbi:SMU1112c/YaeR family gloxylase I-like metalloprotein [Sphingobacterium endophyticum]|uniref:SMU1112c/YaeR family gloxylase I-like metalloprotein n=1 Tax=Sphingobacterium endophyticum TaxID=2546448 RepID=UPI0012E2A708|nr:VOC family protein [Sphingobacterium endophyticum]